MIRRFLSFLRFEAETAMTVIADASAALLRAIDYIEKRYPDLSSLVEFTVFYILVFWIFYLVVTL